MTSLPPQIQAHFNLLDDIVVAYTPRGKAEQYPPPLAPRPTNISPLLPVQSNPKPTESVNSPLHYTSHPSGIECIEITEHFNFNMGNAIKYIFRCDYKGKPLEDLKKARWYLDREIAKREKTAAQPQPASITSTVFAVQDTSLRSIVNFDAKPTKNYWAAIDQ